MAYNMTYLADNKRLTQKVFALGCYSKKHSISLNKKAVRQKWSYFTDNSGSGTPTKLYPLDMLPNEIQIAWAQWDEYQYNEARIKEELKGEKSETHRIPPPITKDQAKIALAWPERTTWFKEWPPGHRPKTGAKVYDGKSKGLCPQARKILLERFSGLDHVTPLNKISEAQTDPPVSQATRSADDQLIQMLHQQIDDLQKENRILKSQNTELKQDKADLRADKEGLREEINFLKEEIEYLKREMDQPKRSQNSA